MGDLSLPVLAIQSGGLALNSSNNIAGLIQECVADAAPYYEISFDSSPADRSDEYHHLEVKVAKPGLTARTRQGYYAWQASTPRVGCSSTERRGGASLSHQLVQKR